MDYWVIYKMELRFVTVNDLSVSSPTWQLHSSLDREMKYSQQVALTLSNVWNCHLQKSIPMDPNELQSTGHTQNLAELYPYLVY